MEYRVQQADAAPFDAEFRVGGLYDSRVGSTSGGADEDSDKALVLMLAAGWQPLLKGEFGLRLDYAGYVDFHKDFGEYDAIDQSLSLEPQYRRGPLVFGLPVSLNVALQAGEDDYVRYLVTPTVTYLFRQAPPAVPLFPTGPREGDRDKEGETLQAVSLYGIGAQLDDRDKDRTLDEDGRTLGLGCAYLHLFGNGSRVRLSLDYLRTEYDARIADYGTGAASTERREDDAVVAGVDILFRLTAHFGLYANYSFTRSHSNVSLYDYDRHVAGGGVALSF